MCPSTNSPSWKELLEAVGDPAAYFFFNKNEGKPMDQTPNGKISPLFKELLASTNGDRIKAIQLKAKYYTQAYLATNDWLSNFIEEPKLNPEQPFTNTVQVKTFLNPKDYINHSGGAYGGDTYWDILGRKFGVVNHYHYRDSGNVSLSKQLRDKGIKAEVLSKELMDKARLEVENLLGKKYPDTLQGNLQVRNYYQVANSDGVFAIAKLEPSIDKSKPDNTTDINKSIKSYKFDKVSGGTNTAVQLGIKLNKPTYVWNITTEQWYKFNGIQFEKTETPILTKNFAGVGSRDIENYQTKNKDTGVWEDRKEYIGREKEKKAVEAIKDVYKKTFKVKEKYENYKELSSELSEEEFNSLSFEEQQTVIEQLKNCK